jgi:hypothetical protein
MATATHGVQTDILDIDDQRQTSGNKLEHQAATAALYVTGNSAKSKSGPGFAVLDDQQRLSSAGKHFVFFLKFVCMYCC